MYNLWPRIEPLLARVEKPARYIGMEKGSLAPAHGPGRTAFLLIYPDTYEIGLPNQGLQILYEILNERSDAVAERAYSPWTDMEHTMRAAGVPLFSVDTHQPADAFDVLAFNLSAELVYTNLLNLVDLAGVPVRNDDRAPEHPIVIAGGHCAYNPEPLAEYVDAFVIGDGEEVIGEIADVIGASKRGGRASREAVLHDLATIDGVYVPAMYDVEYDGPALRAVIPRYADVPPVIDKRTVADLAEWPYPKNQLVPLVEVVHDRLNVEIFRGCTRGCRFCQAGMITRPVRERPEEQVRTMVQEGLRRTGYDEVALTSLSSADFSGIDNVVADLVSNQEGTGTVSVSLPSLRVDAFSVGIASEIQKVRRTGLTFAPEAGSWRLRQVINKLIVEDDLYSAVDAAYSQGWRRMKLYFLTGLPTEVDEDTFGHRGSRVQRGCHRAEVHEASDVHGVGRRVRPEAAHALPMVRPERCRRVAAQDHAVAQHDEGHACPSEMARPVGDVRRGNHVARRPPDRARHRAGVAGRRDVPGVERALRARPLGRCHARRGPRPELVRHPAPHPRRGAPVVAHHGRPPRRLPVGRLAGRAGRARPPRLPVDALLRLRCVHRLRPRTRGGVAGRTGGRLAGHRPGPDPRRRQSPCRSSAPSRTAL